LKDHCPVKSVKYILQQELAQLNFPSKERKGISTVEPGLYPTRGYPVLESFINPFFIVRKPRAATELDPY
jgi:hypothetical protein